MSTALTAGGRSASEPTTPLALHAVWRSELAGWGNVPVAPGTEARSEDLLTLTRTLPLARGLGRAYGDAALPAPGDFRVAGTRLADRVVAFDEESGILVAEAGLSLDAIYRIFLPRGFFAPVTPGTRFVTLGGMVACDVHGKNHHAVGCFGEHVQWVTLRVGDGQVVTCSPTIHPDLFWATIGGMGLTGAILEVAVRLTRVPSPWIYEEREVSVDLDHSIERLKAAAAGWPMTVAWVDCLAKGRSTGRGIVMRGRWAQPQEARRGFPETRPALTVPRQLPAFARSRWVVRAFNAAHHRWGRLSTAGHGSIVHPHAFFYPLDRLAHWPRLYGRGGFVQYQCVLPEAREREGARAVVDLLRRSGETTCLCVVKDCGPEGRGMLSFPMKGISLALDIPKRDSTQTLVDALNELVLSVSGRIYLAKDALSKPDHFRAMEPRLERFMRVRRTWDPQGRIRSAQSVRLLGW